jgi:hypothetical protein
VVEILIGVQQHHPAALLHRLVVHAEELEGELAQLLVGVNLQNGAVRDSG